ncbi:hypothetical protein G6F57_012718 [Rhizopus arrhizus]|uniref:Uncharacterized protein n=1 Tax=Rhizopus oryzae TaxID=64495 RepID=A0A9P6WYD9_RHIOR|nr:hypothetical protein G6F23_010318 [Rhizopus arrhizus]KAG1223793.1 hypothetical protein G6F68_020251 [Rhizopus microsporus]KAG1418521.1 hypothetical protein G6F58_005049 [Rhizopus delemar]KAG0765805.1 hypothetical protein G6F24_004114 [Rhizopus arrhizus]KAG0786684.1 hypothetical protein G6F22_007554 [Rhizopus arrhizus]
MKFTLAILGSLFAFAMTCEAFCAGGCKTGCVYNGPLSSTASRDRQCESACGSGKRFTGERYEDYCWGPTSDLCCK